MKETLLSLAAGRSRTSQIARHLNKHDSQVTQTLQTLEGKNLVSKEDHSQEWKVTQFGAKVALELTGDKVLNNSSDRRRSVKSRKVRGHNLRALFRVKQAPQGWREMRKEFFKVEEIRDTGLKHVIGVEFTKDGWHCHANPDSIVMTLKEPLRAESAADVIEEFTTRAWSMQKKLQREYKGLVLSDRPKILVQEHAPEADVLADLKGKEGYTVIKHTDNQTRAILDTSPGYVELDWVHPGMAHQDADTWPRRVLQVLDSPYDYDMMGAMLEGQEAQNMAQDEMIKDVAGILATLKAIFGEQHEQIGGLTDAVNMLRERTANPLEELKRKIEKPQDVLEYAEVIEQLSDEDKKALDQHLWSVTG